VRPALPGHWEGFKATLRLSDAVYRIEVRREKGAEPAIEIDGERRAGSEIELKQAGEVEIAVIIPG
jgi:cyclic beta-1,2-glucan synthetase